MRVQLWRFVWLAVVVCALFAPGLVFAAGVD